MREIILGCPGCGKTTALLKLVEGEIAGGTPPDRIAYVTFTRRAAEEAVDRACKLFGFARNQLPLFRTLHSLAFRQMGLSVDEVFQGSRIAEFAEWGGFDVSPRGAAKGEDREGTPTHHRPADRALHMENLARVRCEPLRAVYDDACDGLEWCEVDRLARSLESFKRRHGLVDFTDMLGLFLSGDESPEVDVLVVDEAQDLSPLQWLVVDRLAEGARRVVIAGDDDQCIFSWSGADAGHLISMEGAACVLEQSYRVPVAVQHLANTIINPVSSRRHKRWRPRAEEGSVREGALEDDLWSGEWADGVQPMLVLARNNYVLEEQVVPALRAAGVLYEWGAQPPVPTATLAAVHAWEQLRRGEAATADAVRGIYRLLGGADLGRGCRDLPGVPDDATLTMDDLCAAHGLRTRAPWYEALVWRMGTDDVNYLRSARARGERMNQRPRVRLSTIHSAKGGEARRVVLCTEMAARTWREMDEREDDERRVWYVGVTRAREELVVVRGGSPEQCPWV